MQPQGVCRMGWAPEATLTACPTTAVRPGLSSNTSLYCTRKDDSNIFKWSKETQENCPSRLSCAVKVTKAIRPISSGNLSMYFLRRLTWTTRLDFRLSEMSSNFGDLVWLLCRWDCFEGAEIRFSEQVWLTPPSSANYVIATGVAEILF